MSELQNLDKLLKTFTINGNWKTSIYKNRINTIDLIYREVRFGIDIKIAPTEYHFKVIWRKGFKYLSKKFKWESSCLHSELSSSLNNIVEKVYSFINEQFKYDVSIIIPVYNRGELILECIRSINNQTLDKNRFEVIFVDDCSTDDSISKIENNISRDISYRIISTGCNTGNASIPRNLGIKCSKGKYIFFVDSDDYINNNLLANAVLYSDSNNLDITYIKIKGVNRNSPLRSYKKEYVPDASIREHHLFRSNGPMKFYRASMIKDNNLLFNPELMAGEDKMFNISSLLLANKVGILADQEYYFAVAHQGEHLSRQEVEYFDIYSRLLLKIITIDDESKKKQSYNALLILVLEILHKLKESQKDLIRNLFLSHIHLFDEMQIYKSERDKSKAFLNIV